MVPDTAAPRTREAIPTVQVAIRVTPELREAMIDCARAQRLTFVDACRKALQAAVDTQAQAKPRGRAARA